MGDIPMVDEPVFADPFECPACGSSNVELYRYRVIEEGARFYWIQRQYVLIEKQRQVPYGKVQLSCGTCHRIHELDDYPSVTAEDDFLLMMDIFPSEKDRIPCFSCKHFNDMCSLDLWDIDELGYPKGCESYEYGQNYYQKIMGIPPGGPPPEGK